MYKGQDRHGRALLALAVLLNALDLVGKKIEDCRFVVSGAGAAGISCSEFYISAGARRENFLMLDSKGVITKDRPGLTPEKARFAADTDRRTLADALKGADVFPGLSVGNCVTPEMVKSMALGAVSFAMSDTVPKIFTAHAGAESAADVVSGR